MVGRITAVFVAVLMTLVTVAISAAVIMAVLMTNVHSHTVAPGNPESQVLERIVS
jgi:hypothetical protein